MRITSKPVEKPSHLHCNVASSYNSNARWNFSQLKYPIAVNNMLRAFNLGLLWVAPNSNKDTRSLEIDEFWFDLDLGGCDTVKYC